jgi:hypothetical protein
VEPRWHWPWLRPPRIVSLRLCQPAKPSPATTSREVSPGGPLGSRAGSGLLLIGLVDTGEVVPPEAAIGGWPTSLAREPRGAGLEGFAPWAAAQLAGPKARSTKLGANLRRPQARTLWEALGATGDDPRRLGIG